MTLKNNICVRYNLGMGDTLICSGLIRQLAKTCDLVVVMSKPGNYESTAYLFHDLPNVVVRYVVDDEGASLFFNEVWKGKKLLLGCGGNGNFDESHFDQEFYRQAEMSFQLRWDNFHVQRESCQEVNLNMFSAEPEFIFVHQDVERGFRIEENQIRLQNRGFKLPEIVKPDKRHSNNLFAWIPALMNASQIHCINSSFALLVDSLPRVEGQKLFLHQYARTIGQMPTLRYDWQVLK